MGDPGLAYSPGKVTVVPNVTTALGPGAAEYSATQILVVYQPSTGSVKARLVTINSSTGNVTYGSEMTPWSGVTATGDITALKTATGQVTVWFRTGSGSSARLREVRYQNSAWSDQGNQLWTDGTNIVPLYGIGATRGYQDGSSTARTYAAIPMNPNGLVEFVRKDTSSPFRWSRVTFTCPSGNFGCSNGSASSWAGTGGACPASSTDRPCTAANPDGTQPLVSARPGLAYQRRGGQSQNNVGRFYMAINQAATCVEPFGEPTGNPSDPYSCGTRLIMTEGNLISNNPTSRRFTWITPSHWLSGELSPGGLSLVHDLTRDTNLRATFLHTDGWGRFMPLADGIVNGLLSDMDDRVYVSGALRASLCREGGVWPDQCVWPPHLL
jgi:hypothetical protein